MTAENTQMIKRWVSSLVTSIIGGLMALIGFYYQTNSRLDNLEQAINKLEQKDRELSQVQFESQRIYAKLEGMERDDKNIRDLMSKLYERQEKVYDLILQMK